MKRRILLVVDAVINLVLGILLLSFSPALCAFIGVPASSTAFYPNILGAVLVGICIALMIEALKKNNDRVAGLGLIGAVCINLCGGFVLLWWLFIARVSMPLRGFIFLLVLAVLLIFISILELFADIKRTS